jgi:hypothetical protein
MEKQKNPSYVFTGYKHRSGGAFALRLLALPYISATTKSWPAAGNRNRSSGSLDYVGTLGSYWSASPYSSTSYYASLLNFYSGYVNVYYDNYRAYGFSVRCSQASTGLTALFQLTMDN